MAAPLSRSRSTRGALFVAGVLAAAATGCGAETASQGVTPYAPPLPVRGIPLVVTGIDGASWAELFASDVHEVRVVVHAGGHALDCDQYRLELPPETARALSRGSCTHGATRLAVRDVSVLVDNSEPIARHRVPPVPDAYPVGDRWRSAESLAARTCAADVRPFAVGAYGVITWLPPSRVALANVGPAELEEYRLQQGEPSPVGVRPAHADVQVTELADRFRIAASGEHATVGVAYDVVDRVTGRRVQGGNVVLTCGSTPAPPLVPVVVHSPALPVYGPYDECTSEPCVVRAPTGVTAFVSSDSYVSRRTPHIESVPWTITVPPGGATVNAPSTRYGFLAGALPLLATFYIPAVVDLANGPREESAATNAALLGASGGMLALGGLLLYLGLTHAAPDVTPLEPKWPMANPPVR